MVTVSGLHSNIGKTLLAEHLISLRPGCAALKISITDNFTRVTDDEAVIMVAGKDTCRLKQSGAGIVVWVQSRAADLEIALGQAARRVRGYPLVLAEGNSILDLLTPDLSFFVCDSRIVAARDIKPNRLMALARADIIISNLRCRRRAEDEATARACRDLNQRAAFYAIDLADQQATRALVRPLLHKAGLCPAS